MMKTTDNEKSDNSIIASYSFPVLDGVGNRKQAVVNEPLAPVVNPESTDYTYNEKKNRLEAAISDQQSAFSYDNEGQLASINADAYSFDYEHRLTTAAVSGQQSAFSYDGKGNKLRAVRNGVTTKYIYDASGHMIAEADSSNSITAYYIYGGNGLLAMVTPSDQVYAYHFNAIGSTIAMTDQSQNIVNKYSYDVFGKVLNEVEGVTQPFKYVGQYGVMAENCELNAGCFLYMRARYYDPNVGRFISEDPIGFEGGTVNLYEYVGNQPVNRIDPLGLSVFPEDYYKFPPTGGWPPTSSDGQKCLVCNWGNIRQCVAETYETDQIELCKAVCDQARNTGNPVAVGACALCVSGKTSELGHCFTDNCVFEPCCKK